MPFDIEGWIEVARYPDTDGQFVWFAVVRLSSLIDVYDDDSEKLFGLSKLCVTGEKQVDSLVANRGFPENPSETVRKEMDDIKSFDAKHGPGDTGGYTHALWSEIQDYTLLEKHDSQWQLPFILAEKLAERYGPARVRFVVWFNW